MPSSHRRGRKPPPVGYCPGIRASARCGARRRNKLAGWDRRRACLQRRQAFNSSSSAASPSELGWSAHSDPAPCVQPSKEMASRHDSRLREDRLIAVLPPAVRSSAAQDAALVNRKYQATAMCRSTPAGCPCRESCMSADTGKLADRYVTNDSTTPRLAPSMRGSSTPTTIG